jgi:hypothetical protein
MPAAEFRAGGLAWSDVARLSPAAAKELRGRPVSQTELYPLVAAALGTSIQATGQQWQTSVDEFATGAMPGLQRRVDALRHKVARELLDLTRSAADEADEVSRDLVVGQRLKVKLAVDVIEKLLRRRRRRFRWVRRAGWLAVEWVLVGFMWYVWFLVMIARLFVGIGNGLLGGIRWLLWL